ncbi:hypothetical protein FBU30_009920 [Linnemannia zychae]|nr:hypothetical protein FBU30_009920 [Linnemannia zychae]
MRFTTLSALVTLTIAALVQAAPAQETGCNGASLTLANGAKIVCNNCAITNVSGGSKTISRAERTAALQECAAMPLETGECYYFNGQLYCPHPCSRC